MKCKHKNLSHYEIIEAEHGTHYDCEGNVWFNNEYGGKIMDLVTCHDCNKSWKVNNSSPKFVKDFDIKVKKDWEIEDCEEGKLIMLNLCNGETYTGIFKGMDGDDIMLGSLSSENIIGLSTSVINDYFEEIKN